jgi:hypothetical protein
MKSSPEEERAWRELSAELRRDRRLAAHLAHFNVVVRLRRNIAAARTGAAIPPIAWIPAVIGACVGLSLLIAGAVEHSNGLSTGGITVFVTVTVLTGIVLIAIGTAGARHTGTGHADPGSTGARHTDNGH